MKEMFEDIREKLRNGFYQNEEHVRLCLVARVLQKLDWDIWNPKEVNAEFVAVPTEDRTKVDVALFVKGNVPSAFIEVKAPGKIANLEQIENQLRDYNRNITAPFCIITDGNVWSFYFSLTGGAFHSKCFKTISLMSDDAENIDNAIRVFTSFLHKSALMSGEARTQAESLLRLTQKEKAMEDCLTRARHAIQEPPYPRLVDAMVALVREEGFDISEVDAEAFLKKVSSGKVPQPGTGPGKVSPPHPPPSGGVITLQHNEHVDLKFTRILEARIGPEKATKWNDLASAGIRLALGKGYSISRISSIGNANIQEGVVTEAGFHRVEGTNLCLQYMEANRAWQCAQSLAKELSLEIVAHFQWREKEGAAKPGQQAIIRFP